MIIDRNAVIQAREDVAWRMIENQVIIVDGRFDKVHTLNPVATSIWIKIQEEKAFGDLATELLDEFEIDDKTLLQDLKELIEQLHTFNLLVTDYSAQSIGE